MKKKWKVILCIALAAVAVLIGLICFPPDTDPEAPFRDLPSWQKNNIRKAVEKALSEENYQGHWFGEPVPEDNSWQTSKWDFYTIRYYGTFNGYRIVLASMQVTPRTKITLEIGETTFQRYDTFWLFAYRNGSVISLEEAYNRGLLDAAQIKQIGQCYERYELEVYRRNLWGILYEKDGAGLYWLLAGCILLAVAGAGIVIFQVRIKCGLSKLIAGVGNVTENCRKKKWKIALCIVLAAVVLCGSLTAWWFCFQPDTNPEAPFKDLSNWEKQRVLVGMAKYWAKKEPSAGPVKLFWYGERWIGQETELNWKNYSEGMRYYGTFGGYHIVLVPLQSMTTLHVTRIIGGFPFKYGGAFNLFACKGDTVILLEQAFNEKLLSVDQMRMISRCYQRYNEEIYIRETWEENEENQRNQRVICALYVCGAVAVLAGMGFGIFRVCRNYRKQRSKDLQ